MLFFLHGARLAYYGKYNTALVTVMDADDDQIVNRSTVTVSILRTQ